MDKIENSVMCCVNSCEGCMFTRRAFLSAGAGFALMAAGCSDIGQNYITDKKAETIKEAKKMDNLKFVTYCGLYCGLCSHRGRVPQQANTLRETMAKEGWDKWATAMPGFNEFWKFLTDRCDPDKCCPGCRRGGGRPDCPIRECARKKKVDICVFCEEYPCEHILGPAKLYPTLIADGKRLKEIGIEAWMAEQQKRAKTGFAYCDIRYDP